MIIKTWNFLTMCFDSRSYITMQKTCTLVISSRLSSTNFTWSILEYFVPFISNKVIGRFEYQKITCLLEFLQILHSIYGNVLQWSYTDVQELADFTTENHSVCLRVLNLKNILWRVVGFKLLLVLSLAQTKAWHLASMLRRV